MNRKRPKQIVVRLSEEEYQKVKGKIEKAGMKQQEYLIRAILNKPVINTNGLKEIIPELKRQGNNLNQIARKLNENGYVDYKGELSSALRGSEELWRYLKQYLQKPESEQ